MRGALLWTRRGTWSRRMCWRAARSASWQRPTECIAAGSTSSWPATGSVAMAPWSALQGAAQLPQPNLRRDGAGNRRPARAAGRRRPRLRCDDDRLPPCPPDRSGAFGLDDLANPQAGGPCQAAAPKAPTLIADPLRSRAAQRDVAGRCHALASRRRGAGGDSQHARRSLAAVLGLAGLPDRQGGGRGRRLSHGGRPAWCSGLPALRQRRVFTATPRGGKVLLQAELERLGIAAKNSRPYHPQTCGKVERLHQTLKRYLARQAPARTLTGLQEQLDGFTDYYNARWPHRALGGRTPLQAYGARVKARLPSAPSVDTHFRIRQDKVDGQGTVTLRHDSKLHHIGIGRAHQGRAVKLLIADRDIRVLDLETGELDPSPHPRSQSRLPADRRD